MQLTFSGFMAHSSAGKPQRKEFSVHRVEGARQFNSWCPDQELLTNRFWHEAPCGTGVEWRRKQSRFLHALESADLLDDWSELTGMMKHRSEAPGYAIPLQSGRDVVMWSTLRHPQLAINLMILEVDVEGALAIFDPSDPVDYHLYPHLIAGVPLEWAEQMMASRYPVMQDPLSSFISDDIWGQIPEFNISHLVEGLDGLLKDEAHLRSKKISFRISSELDKKGKTVVD